jgi:hypothetical protein
MAKPSPQAPPPGYASKKCPECYTYVPLKAQVCHSCKTRLGEVGPNGMARRLTNWKAYVICIVAWLVFAVYVKWAFF